MAATGSVPARARRHPITVVNRARELVRGGWSADAAVDILAREGVTVTRSTVRRWTDPKHERADARRGRERAVRKSREIGARPMGPHYATPAFKLERMRALREKAGLKDAQIARLMAFDFGDEMTREAVARALDTGRYPRS